MAENPLLPNAELQALLALTRRCVVLDTAARRRSSYQPLPSREALLSATVLQLKPGDLLLPEPGDTVAPQLRSEQDEESSATGLTLPDLGRNPPRLLLAAAMAAALRQSGTDRIVLANLHERLVEPHWRTALEWAQQQQLPLVLVCADPRGDGAFRPDPRASVDAFSWQTVRRSTNRLQLALLSVDGEDAVAVYRAMQESALRARSGAGPAILWAMLPPRRILATRPNSAKPLRRLQRNLRTRKIPF